MKRFPHAALGVSQEPPKEKLRNISDLWILWMFLHDILEEPLKNTSHTSVRTCEKCWENLGNDLLHNFHQTFRRYSQGKWFSVLLKFPGTAPENRTRGQRLQSPSLLAWIVGLFQHNSPMKSSSFREQVDGKKKRWKWTGSWQEFKTSSIIDEQGLSKANLTSKPERETVLAQFWKILFTLAYPSYPIESMIFAEPLEIDRRNNKDHA